MARNILFTMTTGETGKQLWFKFEPTDTEGRAEAVDLTGWAITVSVTKAGTSTVFIDDAECTADPDQVNNIGEGTFIFSEEQAELPVGDYRLRFKGIDGDANVLYFPTLPNRTYAMLKVLAQ
jgi:hypothetical protein